MMCYYTYINVNEALNKTRRIYGKKLNPALSGQFVFHAVNLF